MAMKHHAVDVVIEVPRGSRNKYEWDEKAKLMRLDRRVPGAVSFPRIMDSFGGHSARTAIPSTSFASRRLTSPRSAAGSGSRE